MQEELLVHATGRDALSMALAVATEPYPLPPEAAVVERAVEPEAPDDYCWGAQMSQADREAPVFGDVGALAASEGDWLCEVPLELCPPREAAAPLYASKRTLATAQRGHQDQSSARSIPSPEKHKKTLPVRWPSHIAYPNWA